MEWFVEWLEDDPSVLSAISAIFRAIGAASGHGARGRASHNPPAVGSSPTRPTCENSVSLGLVVDRVVDRVPAAGLP